MQVNDVWIKIFSSLINDFVLFSFSRSITGSSFDHDLDLNDNYYLMYGLGATLATSMYY